MELVDLYWFIITFIIVYLFYLISFVFKKQEFNPEKIPVELHFLIKKYKLDMKKIKYKSIMNIIGLVSAFDVSFTATFVFKFIKNIYIAIIVGAIMLIPLIFITFNFIGSYYRKKGMIKNGK